jgi:hypothetical protein
LRLLSNLLKYYFKCLVGSMRVLAHMKPGHLLEESLLPLVKIVR